MRNGLRANGGAWYDFIREGIMVSVDDGTQMLYFLSDHLGSVVAITDTDGALLDEQRHMPFGQAM